LDLKGRKRREAGEDCIMKYASSSFIIREIKVGEACSTHRSYETCTGFRKENPKGRDH
jgi:hypothetical protein